MPSVSWVSVLFVSRALDAIVNRGSQLCVHGLRIYSDADQVKIDNYVNRVSLTIIFHIVNLIRNSLKTI